MYRDDGYETKRVFRFAHSKRDSRRYECNLTNVHPNWKRIHESPKDLLIFELRKDVKY